MRTIKIIIVTALVTLFGTGIGTGYYLLNEGIVTVSERGTNHTEVRILDDVEVERKTWFETTGIEVNTRMENQIVIGK